jgi:hypothetical protein
VRRVIAIALLAGALILPSGAWAAEDVGALEEVAVESTADATSSRGCRTVDVARVGRDIFGFVVYKFHQVKRWCWESPRITWRQVYTYVSDVDPNMKYRGIVSSVGYFYRWCCSSSSSGHYSRRQGRFDNCVWWLPCTRTEYPWVKIYAHADGSYWRSTGL